ncbi:replication initiator protein A [Pseudomonas peli]|uniref:replication initiator protein A n=1 Tax=Pseudomonas peli TaxID=592361 RepID=UPI003D314550
MIEDHLSPASREALQRGIERQKLQESQPRETPILKGVSARDARVVMDVAVFQLSKTPRPNAELSYSLDDGSFVRVRSGDAGMATAWDYDIVMIATGHLVRLVDQSARDRTQMPGRTVVIPRSELLNGDGRNQYDRLFPRLERLLTTTVQIRRQSAKNLVETSVEGLITGFKVLQTGARVTLVEITLPTWLYSEVVSSRTPNVLSIPDAYFSIPSSLGRYIYRVAKFAAKQEGRYRFETLYRRSSSTENFRQFSSRLRRLIEENLIPEFELRQVDGVEGPLLLMRPRK